MALDPDKLQLTDFLDLSTLQEIQDSFTAVAGVKAIITDADGHVLTQPEPTAAFLRRQRTLAEDGNLIQNEGEFVAPIVVNDQQLGTLRMALNGALHGASDGLDEEKLSSLSLRLGLPPAHLKTICSELSTARGARPAAIQFMFLMANAIARLCFQEFQLRQRINELTAVYHVAMILADARDLQKVLTRTVKVVCDIMQTKAASIRLIDEERDELVIKAVFNLSAEYLNKGPVRMSTAEIDKIALSHEGFEYVRNMGTDPRIQYPQESVREGIVSMLSVGLRYKGKSVGVLRVYTDEEQAFSPLKIDLLKAVGAQAAAAIENARLVSEAREAEVLEKQVRMAADVQQRMIPQKPPEIPGLDLASEYVPCFELGGDFFDFIPLPEDNIGLAIADVSGKGLPASLIMASVRAFLRAQVDNVYYLYEVIRRINLMICRDTKVGEFVTLFYGVLNATTRRFTYCNAGHPAPLLLRDGKVTELSASDNMVLGISVDEVYKQFIVDLQPGDSLLLYTDGVTDAANFNKERYGRERLTEAFARGGETAEIVSQNVLWDLRKFVGMAPPIDDITLMTVRVK
ncbi:MAG TPA: SpoIIE family protein phosphatase [Tepidisphaeraceae bacterium]|jgi:serine phosphatase RsbU (regulator of sigma subunit)|nr:SpoIIE family protein phosphatase [Tepidisphaeraceae bacterium]